MPITGDATVITIRALSITDPVYTIVGQIVDDADDGLDGVLVTLSGDASDTYTTGSGSFRSGIYHFIGLSNGDYTVTPTKTGYTFVADHEDVTIAYDSEIVDDMVGTAVWLVSGYILDGDSDGIESVTVTLSGDDDDTDTTDANGYYSFTLPDGSYTVTPTKATYSFSANHEDVTVSGAAVTVDTMVGTTGTYISLPITWTWPEALGTIFDGGWSTVRATDAINKSNDGVATLEGWNPYDTTYANGPTPPGLSNHTQGYGCGTNDNWAILRYTDGYDAGLKFDMSQGLRFQFCVSFSLNEFRNYFYISAAKHDPTGFEKNSATMYGDNTSASIVEKNAAGAALKTTSSALSTWTQQNHWYIVSMEIPAGGTGDMHFGVITCNSTGAGYKESEWVAFTPTRADWGTIGVDSVTFGQYYRGNTYGNNDINYAWAGTASDTWPIDPETDPNPP